MKTTYHVTYIDWCYDDEPKPNLPSELYIDLTETEDDEYEITEYLSDKYGYLVNSFYFEPIEPDPIYQFCYNEAEFRLIEQFNIEDPTTSLIEKAAEALYEHSEEWIDSNAIYDIIEKHI